MLIIAGWRGMPGLKDEPQHVQQGAIMLEVGGGGYAWGSCVWSVFPLLTIQMLQGVRMPYAILPADEEKAIAVCLGGLW